MIPELLPTALAFYRAPGQYAHLRDAWVPLPAGVTELLGAQALAPAQIDDTAARLNSSPDECRAAVIFFIKQALLEARGDYYRTLGVSRNADSALIRQHYHYLIRLFHPDRDLDSEGWETLYAPVINEAWNQLRTPAKRSQYDASLPQPDGFDAVWARGHDPAGGEAVAATSRASAPGARAGASAVLAGLPPRLVLGLVFGVPLLLVLLWLLARPGPQNLRMAGQDMVLPEAAQSDPPPAATVAGGHTGEGESAPGAGGDPAAETALATRAAPRRATSEELEQQVRKRLASATSAVLGPGAGARTRRQTPQPAADTAAQAAIPAPGPEAVPAAFETPALPALDAAQLGAMVAAFARSYEAGDVQHFSALFAANADTSDARGRDEIRQLYRGFFARPETREIRFGQMLWEYYGPFRSRGTGLARVTTAPLDGGEPASGELMITLEVEQTSAGPSIVVLHYH